MGNGEWGMKMQPPFPVFHSPFPIPHSPFPIPHSPFPIPHSPFIIKLVSTTCPSACWRDQVMTNRLSACAFALLFFGCLLSVGFLANVAAKAPPPGEDDPAPRKEKPKIGRASCRERV